MKISRGRSQGVRSQPNVAERLVVSRQIKPIGSWGETPQSDAEVRPFLLMF